MDLTKINNIVENGGPEPEDYPLLTSTCQSLMNSKFTLTEESKLYEVIKPLLTVDSMIGFSFVKPNGYAGDYELIDRIYNKWKSPHTKTFHKWDDFYHDLAAARAVRNRKDYLIELLCNLQNNTKKPRILNLGSGPCSDIHQFFTENPNSSIHFDCLDMDKNAIEYATTICDNYIDSISFINKNAFRFRPEKEYNFIWSAGLFDYFSDKLFIRLLNRTYNSLAQNGKLVIGNFAEDNPTRGVMEVFGQWYLHHRSKDKLTELAIEAGVAKKNIVINSENTGVNLFLHITKT